MSFYNTAFRSSLVVALSACLLAGCRPDLPDAPAPIVVTPVVDVPTPPQYGTPYNGVPNREDAVIYQVNIRAFSQSGKLAGVLPRLDSIRALGVNVLYLMPIYPVGTDSRSVNSPYAVKDYRAVNPEFGTLADLRALVDGAHERDMSVMLDWVPNHTSWDNPWVSAHPEWYKKDAAGNIAAVSNNGTTYSDVAQLDFSSMPMRASLISAMKSWVFAANVDGFRFDYGDFQPDDFWKQAIDTLRHVKTHKLLLLNEGTHAANFTNGFDYNFGFGFYGGLKEVYRNNKPATTLDAFNTSEYAGATGTQQVVRYTTNHDVNSSDGTPVQLFSGHAGAMSAFVIAALYKGVPFIYNGQEAGMTTPITFPFTTTKVAWDARPDVTQAYKQVLSARANSAPLRRGTPASFSTAGVCAFTKTIGTAKALVLVNVRNANTQFQVPAALAGDWSDDIQGGNVTLGGTLTLPPYGYRILEK